MNKYLTIIVAIFMAVAMVSCESGNAEIEKKLAGEWQFSFQDNEEGLDLQITFITDFSVEDHVVTATETYYMCYPINETMCEVSYNGTWYATKNKIVIKVDVNSVNFSFNQELFDREEREDYKKTWFEDLKNFGNRYTYCFKGAIEDDSFLATDDEDKVQEFIRMNPRIVERTNAVVTKSIPNDKTVISGDFDGDGQEDHLWIEGEGTDDYEPVEFVLCSDNPRLDGQTWTAIYGVDLYNVGKLDDSGRDFLGVVPVCMSNWEAYLVYGFRNGWNESLEPISMFSDNGRNNRVTKSSTPGYVVIREDKMDFDNGGLESVCREVRLN